MLVKNVAISDSQLSHPINFCMWYLTYVAFAIFAGDVGILSTG